MWQHLEHNGLICWCQMMRAEEGQSALSFLMKVSLLMGHEDQAFSTPLLSLVDLQRIYGGGFMSIGTADVDISTVLTHR